MQKIDNKNVSIYERPELAIDAQEILNDILNLSEAYWIDRASMNTNYGIDGTVGKYDCLHDSAMPILLKEKIYNIIPKVYAFPLLEMMVNRYKKDIGFIPMHVDNVGSLGVLVINLTSSNKDGFIYIDEVGNEKLIKDSAGNAIAFKKLKLKHRVNVVSKDRYSLICLY